MRRIFILAIILFCYRNSWAQTITSAANGNWNAPASWVGGIVPASGNCAKVVIAHNIVVNVPTSISCGLDINSLKRLEINTGITFNVDCAANFTIGFINNGTFTNRGEFYLNGFFRCNSSSFINQTVTTSKMVFDGSNGTSAGSIANGTSLFYLDNFCTTNLTTGIIQFLQPPYGANSKTIEVNSVISSGAGVDIIFGGSTTTTTLSTDGFQISPIANFNFNNLTIDNGTGVPQIVTIKSGYLNCRGNLTVANGEYRALGTAGFGSSTIHAGRDIVNNGTITATVLQWGVVDGTATAPFIMSGTGVWRNKITSATANLSNLNINTSNPYGCDLGINNFLVGTSQVTSGKLNLGSNNLICNVTFPTNNGSNTAWFNTDGTGKLIIRRSAGAFTAKTLPIGSASQFAPVTITASTNGTNDADDFTFRVLPVTNTNDITQCLPVMWEINETIPGGNSGFYIDFNWAPTLPNTNFASAFATPYYFNAGIWAKVSTVTYAFKDISFYGFGLATKAPYNLNQTGLFAVASGRGLLTSEPNVVSTTGNSSNWSQAATWQGGVQPTATDLVNIKTGHTLNVDEAAVCNGINNNGILNFLAANSLTVGAVGGGNAFAYNNGTLNIGSGTLNLNGELGCYNDNTYFNMASGTINVDANSGNAATSVNTSTTRYKGTLLSLSSSINVYGNININDPIFGGNDGIGYVNFATDNLNTTGINYKIGDGVVLNSSNNQFILQPSFVSFRDNLTIDAGLENNTTVIYAGNSAYDAKKLSVLSGAYANNASGDYNIYGDVTVNGTFTCNNPRFVGSTLQNFNGSGAVNWSRLQMNNSNNLNINFNQPVSLLSSISFTAGKIILNNTHLTYAASTSGYASTTSYVVTNGTGQLKSTVATGTTYFPVGSSVTSFTPVKLTVGSGHTSDILGVNVSDGVLQNGTSGTVLTETVVNKTWNITEAVAGGSNLTVSPQWNNTDEAANFVRSGAYVAHFVGTSWDQAAKVAATGSNPYTISRTGITSFSPFSVTSSDYILPIQLLSFSGTKTGTANLLSWMTASEQNVNGFQLQKSTDGHRFDALTFLGSKAINGNSSSSLNYTYTDNSISATTFYRVKVIDKDGRFAYSPIVKLSNVSKGQLSIFPNPVTTQATLQYVSSQNHKVTIKVIDALGKTMLTKQQTVAVGTNAISLATTSFSAGVYVVEVQGSNGKEVVRMVKE